MHTNQKGRQPEGFTGLVPLPLTSERKGQVVPPFSQAGWVCKPTEPGWALEQMQPPPALQQPLHRNQPGCLWQSRESKAEKQPPAKAISLRRLPESHRLAHHKHNHSALNFPCLTFYLNLGANLALTPSLLAPDAAGWADPEEPSYCGTGTAFRVRSTPGWPGAPKVPL